jgi:Uracil DNA glycosylase superfamily
MAVMSTSRIVGGLVPAIFPDSGTVSALVIGEAPGPNGADKSGIPFWGDEAGRLLYGTLQTLGLAVFPDSVWTSWDGASLKRLGVRPRMTGIALTNAFARCPTDNGTSFRSPSNEELSTAENQARLNGDIARAIGMLTGTTLRVVTLGERADTALRLLGSLQTMEVHHLPHPARQGLLQDEPNHGKGTHIKDLEQKWAARLKAILT